MATSYGRAKQSLSLPPLNMAVDKDTNGRYYVWIRLGTPVAA